MIFSKDLRFHSHINNIVKKVNITLGPLYPVAPYLPRPVLNQIYSTYIMPHFDYCDVIYDGLLTTGDCLRLERLQNRSARLVTGTLLRTSTDKLRSDLGWNSLKDRRKIHRIQFLHKLLLNDIPQYIQDTLPNRRNLNTTRELRNLNQRVEPMTRTSNFKNSFLPSTIKLYNELPETIRALQSHKLLKKYIFDHLSIKQPPKYYMYGNKIFNSLLTQLRVNMSSLNGHAHQILRSDTPFCSCGHQNENTKHFLIHCPRYAVQRNVLHRNISLIIGADFSNFPTGKKIKVLLHGETTTENINRAIAKETLKFISNTKRFLD